MAQSYPPLRTLEILNKHNRGINNIYSFFKTIPEVQKLSKETLLRYFLRENFFRHPEPIQYGLNPVNLYSPIFR